MGVYVQYWCECEMTRCSHSSVSYKPLSFPLLIRRQLSNADALELSPNKILQTSQWILFTSFAETISELNIKSWLMCFANEGFAWWVCFKADAPPVHTWIWLPGSWVPLISFSRWGWDGLQGTQSIREDGVPGPRWQLCWRTWELYSVFRENPQLCSHKTRGISFCAYSCPFVKIWTLTFLPMASGTSVLQPKPISCRGMNGSWVSTYLQQEAVTSEIHEWMDIKLYEKTKFGQIATCSVVLGNRCFWDLLFSSCIQ